MSSVTIEEAKKRLGELIDQLDPGEELVITNGDEAVATLTATRPKSPRQREPGTLRGSVLHLADDFDAPLDDFEDALR